MLILWAVVLLGAAINIYGIQILPSLQMVGGVIHIIFFIAITIPIILLARRSTPDFVFTELITSDGGWQSPGIAWCLGMLTVTYCFLGKIIPQIEIADAGKSFLTLAPFNQDSIVLST